MYKGYNLTLNLNQELEKIDGFNEFYKIGKAQNEKTKKSIRKNLDSFTLKNGVINGTDLQKDWFPEVKSHIFLSHSHKDEKNAIILAGFLYEIFKIETFIDSNVWGYSNDILKQIDNIHCKNTDQKTFNYDKRNYSTSHVNLILCTALNKMIDNSECIFFLNTPNSINPASIIDRTISPWIFSEIATTQIIRKKEPKRLIKDHKYSAQMKSLNENLKIEYDLDLSHLANLTDDLMWEWFEKDCNSPEEALDNLYSLAKP